MCMCVCLLLFYCTESVEQGRAESGPLKNPKCDSVFPGVSPHSSKKTFWKGGGGASFLNVANIPDHWKLSIIINNKSTLNGCRLTRRIWLSCCLKVYCPFPSFPIDSAQRDLKALDGAYWNAGDVTQLMSSFAASARLIQKCRQQLFHQDTDIAEGGILGYSLGWCICHYG